MIFLISKTILCFGDSWTGPYMEGIPMFTTWPYKMHELLNCEVRNLGQAGSSNDTIIHDCIKYITLNYVKRSKPLDDVIVIVGWTSPCRRDFVFYEPTNSEILQDTLWPNVDPEHDYSVPMREMYQLYVKYFWTELEMFKRYVHNVVLLQSYLKSLNIKFLMFNAFYEFPHLLELENEDQFDVKLHDASSIIRSLANKLFTSSKVINGKLLTKYTSIDHISNIDNNDKILWNSTVDKDTFYKDGNLSTSFMNFIGKDVRCKDEWYDLNHPTEKSNTLWAKELISYMTEKGILAK